MDEVGIGLFVSKGGAVVVVVFLVPNTISLNHANHCLYFFVQGVH